MTHFSPPRALFRADSSPPVPCRPGIPAVYAAHDASGPASCASLPGAYSANCAPYGPSALPRLAGDRVILPKPMEQNPLSFDDEEVPEPFRHVSGFARRFGHPEYTETVRPESANAEELLRFWAAVAPLRDDIHRWLTGFPKGARLPDSAAAYLYMLQALDYAEPESRAQEEHRRRFWETTIYPNLVKKASIAAESEFRSGNYPGVVALLEPYENDPIRAVVLWSLVSTSPPSIDRLCAFAGARVVPQLPTRRRIRRLQEIQPPFGHSGSFLDQSPSRHR